MLRQDATWAITTYFDPSGTRKRLETYRTFRRNLSIPLVAVELSFQERFQLGEADADILIQLRGEDVLWQKERLVNIALQALPDHCDAVAWLDCDIIFLREDWAAAARGQLEHYALVQPFERVHYMERLDPPKFPDWRPPDYFESFGARYARGELRDEMFATTGASRLLRYAPGMAWMARRCMLAEHGLYDAGVVGGGDALLVAAACGRGDEKASAFQMSGQQRRHYNAWASRFHGDVRGRISFVEGDLLHLWHGDPTQRRYTERFKDFHRFEFDPQADLAHAAEGVYRWNSHKPELHDYVRGHFELQDRAWQISLTCAND